MADERSSVDQSARRQIKGTREFGIATHRRVTLTCWLFSTAFNDRNDRPVSRRGLGQVRKYV